MSSTPRVLLHSIFDITKDTLKNTSRVYEMPTDTLKFTLTSHHMWMLKPK